MFSIPDFASSWFDFFFQQVSHGAIQFTAYEELRKIIVNFKSRKRHESSDRADNVLVSSGVLGDPKVEHVSHISSILQPV